jgi:hypothetical protein
MCQYGNCQSTNIRVTVNVIGEERPAFCCEDHAALWLIRKAHIKDIENLRSEIWDDPSLNEFRT